MTSFFPTQDLLPKSETKADSFLANHPEYDGTGITVGILDTGVDPGAFGLSSCPDHSQKVIHIADCTGSGDVAMNTCAEAVLDEHRNGSWVITNGLLGYDLVLNPKLKLSPFPRNNPNDTTTNTTNMNNHCQETTKPSMPVRLGLKRSYELFPKKLVTRVKEHTQSEWEKEHHELAVPLLKELAQWKETFRVTKPTQEDMRYKEEILARLELIQGKGLCDGDLLKEEPGQLYQVVLYYDGTDYRVIIDTHGNGDLTHIDKGMTDFHKEYEYKRFSNVDMLNYCVNIYQSGQVVSIVCDAGAHGTHVAGITARHHGGKNSHNNNDDDDVNGVAPGAKIVALKIGDSRLGSMETGSALTRAMIEAVKFKCDVINLSYGEGCALPNTGRFVELAEELVYKHKIVFVSSAGNNGPALSTVGAPGGTSGRLL
jgi:tripeptidyl-peptidase II